LNGVADVSGYISWYQALIKSKEFAAAIEKLKKIWIKNARSNRTI